MGSRVGDKTDAELHKMALAVVKKLAPVIKAANKKLSKLKDPELGEPLWVNVTDYPERSGPDIGIMFNFHTKTPSSTYNKIFKMIEKEDFMFWDTAEADYDVEGEENYVQNIFHHKASEQWDRVGYTRPWQKKK